MCMRSIYVLAKDSIKELLITDTNGVLIGILAIGAFPYFHTTINLDANIFLLQLARKII